MRQILRYDDGAWAEAIGGHPALDLVNTVSWRRDPARTVDRLQDDDQLRRWAEFTGVAGEVGDATLARTRRLREQVYRVVQPMAVGEQAEAGDVERLLRTLTSALSRTEVRSVMPLQLAGDDLADELAWHAWRLLQHEDADRLRQCQGDGCGWLFLDRTKNGSRVWCSSADCGNRVRARRHYARRTAAQR